MSSRKTEYIIDTNGKYWLPSIKSKTEGMKRYCWFKNKIGHEGVTASEDKWQELLTQYKIQVLEDNDGDA